MIDHEPQLPDLIERAHERSIDMLSEGTGQFVMGLNAVAEIGPDARQGGARRVERREAGTTRTARRITAIQKQTGSGQSLFRLA